MASEVVPFDRCFEGSRVTAVCKSVYDGDTVKLVVAIPGGTREFLVNCRLTGIDTAEMRGTRGDEKQKAIDARDRLREWILDQPCEAECGRLDKYGRLLVQIFLPGESISCNQRLIDEGLALAYDGGKKASH